MYHSTYLPFTTYICVYVNLHQADYAINKTYLVVQSRIVVRKITIFVGEENVQHKMQLSNMLRDAGVAIARPMVPVVPFTNME